MIDFPSDTAPAAPVATDAVSRRVRDPHATRVLLPVAGLILFATVAVLGLTLIGPESSLNPGIIGTGVVLALTGAFWGTMSVIVSESRVTVPDESVPTSIANRTWAPLPHVQRVSVADVAHRAEAPSRPTVTVASAQNPR